MTARYLVGDVFDQLATLEPGSVDLVFTSPPFLALRSYLPAGHPDKLKEIGSEPDPAAFIDTLLDVVEACARVLAPHGSLVFELGDTFSGSGGHGGDYEDGGMRAGQPKFDGSAAAAQRSRADGGRYANGYSGGTVGNNVDESNAAFGVRPSNGGRGWPEAKSMCFIPQLFGASLAYGRNLLRPERATDRWRIRNVVAWCRPNPPVGALGDKFRPATSYLTVAAKARDRWFDLDAVRTEPIDQRERFTNGPKGAAADPAEVQTANYETRLPANAAGAPPLDWWEIPTQPYKGAHYATFPERLVVRPLLSMCPERVCTFCGEPSRRLIEPSERYAARANAGADVFGSDRAKGRGNQELRATIPNGDMGRGSAEYVTTGWTDCGHDAWRRGVVLDPFAGSGTTLAVAEGHGRDSIGIDLDARNADLAFERVGMWLTVDAAGPPVTVETSGGVL